MEHFLRRKKFTNNDQLADGVAQFSALKPVKFYADKIYNLREICQKVVENNRNYFDSLIFTCWFVMGG